MDRPRDVVAKQGGNMAVVDFHRNLWGETIYTAGVLKTKMVPRIWCETVGTFKTEAEARAAALTALAESQPKPLSLPEGEMT